ncbi:unnamed protein product [Timema podura]|uniref:Uncharacterized protein n=1 Tax=Timema podura TaxID=61482 RepID=A0ABN7P833_TIMPD|nr:unnamed protein product [Timema podura]
MPISPAGMGMTTSVSVSPVSPNYDMHQRVPLSVSGMNMFGNASIPQNRYFVNVRSPCQSKDNTIGYAENICLLVSAHN